MRLRQLEYFVTICESGTFTRAAERLYVAQPSMSQQIKALEAELKVSLFERSARGIRLTSAGEAFLVEARAILASVEHAHDVISNIRSGMSGKVHVLAVRSIATVMLPPVISAWASEFPRVVVQLEDFPHAEAMDDAFRDGVGDLAVGPRPESASGRVATLGYEELVLVGARSAGLSISSTDLRDLRDCRWILFDPQRGLTRTVTKLCVSAGFRPNVAVWASHIEAALELANDGVGISLVPRNVVDAYSRCEAIRVGDGIYREICVSWRDPAPPVVENCVRSLSRARLPLLPRTEDVASGSVIV